MSMSSVDLSSRSIRIARHSRELVDDVEHAELPAAWAPALVAALPAASSYSDLVKISAAGNKQQARGPLNLVARLCLERGWPPLTLMAVRAATKGDLVPMPSDDAFDPKTDRLLITHIPRHEIGVRQMQVRTLDWTPHIAALGDPASYAAVDAPDAPPEIIIGITRRVPEPMIPLLDRAIAALKQMPQPQREATVAAAAPAEAGRG